jgi:hypothetical protein
MRAGGAGVVMLDHRLGGMESLALGGVPQRRQIKNCTGWSANPAHFRQFTDRLLDGAEARYQGLVWDGVSLERPKG